MKEGKDGIKRLETKWGIKKTKQEGGSSKAKGRQ